MRPKRKRPADAGYAVERALRNLQSARDLLKYADCPKAVARVRLALSSAKGARRAVRARLWASAR